MSELNKESVEQAGGDERAAFEAAFAAMGRPVCRADYDRDAYRTPFDDGGWTGWQARAALAHDEQEQAAHELRLLANALGECIQAAGITAPGVPLTGPQLLMFAEDLKRDLQRSSLAQPSPKCNCPGFGKESLSSHAPNCPVRASTAQPSPAQAEVERPGVVARVDGTDEDWFIQPEDETEMHNEGLLFSGCELGRMIDFDRIVGELRADRDSWAEQAEQRLADWDEMRKERDAALARVAEMEMLLRKLSTNGLMQFSTVEEEMAVQAALGGAPVARAQHSGPEGYALIPVRETEAMHDAVMALLYKGVARTDTQKLLDAYIAAAPGKEVGHE